MSMLDERHPADEIGKALSRAGGILASLSNCYEKPDSEFQIGMPFVFESVTTVEKLIAKASEELTKLCENYDLGALPNVVSARLSQNSVEEESNHVTDSFNDDLPIEVAVEAPIAPIANTNTEQVSRLAERLDNILETMPVQPVAPAPTTLLDRPALTYGELLEKVTAMADMAAFQSHRKTNTDQSLLPVLEILRADMLRIRNGTR